MCTGCGQCWTMDGNWKITFPHCMYPVEFTLPGLPGISYPDVCQGQPLSTKQAFCRLHQDLAQQKNIPTDVRGFIKYCKGEAELGM